MSDDEVLSAAWQVWLATGLIERRPVAQLVAALQAEGLDQVRAEREVEALRIQAGTVAGVAVRDALLPHADVTRLRQATRAAASPRVERRADVPADTLRDVYGAHGVPVVMPGWCAGWPSTSWTPEGLAERVGEAVVQVAVGDAPDRDRHWKQHSRTARFADVVRDVLDAPDDGGCYLIAQHRNLDGPLAALLPDLTPDPEVVAVERLGGNASLWFGPGGTVTPTHHDASAILINQVFGRKRLYLAPPDEVRLAEARDGYYSPIRLSDAEVTEPGGALEGGRVYVVTLEPGDTLFLPACWWHEVHALAVSLHVSIVGLRWPNRFEAYRPGFPAEAR